MTTNYNWFLSVTPTKVGNIGNCSVVQRPKHMLAESDRSLH